MCFPENFTGLFNLWMVEDTPDQTLVSPTKEDVSSNPAGQHISSRSQALKSNI